MSGGGFTVSPESLQSSGEGVMGVAERFINELESFESQMEGHGEPWGDDDIGSLIGIAYTEVAAYLFDCLGVAGDELGSAGSDLGAMGEGFQQVEQDVADIMRQFTEILG
jgi:hypothetical protein